MRTLINPGWIYSEFPKEPEKILNNHTRRPARQTGANLGFEDKLWMAADKLRGTMDAAEYKHVVLGLIFLKYISDAFADKYAALAQEPYADSEDRDEYLAASVFWVPGTARWDFLQGKARDAKIGQLIDEALSARSRATTRASRVCCPKVIPALYEGVFFLLSRETRLILMLPASIALILAHFYIE